ncbi:MAG: polysaccharide pyruvyl transferase family protein [Microbacterium sp.]|uniref:polysaccharide pyruvyl transferase family protein n=1 Tax=Microbacterium sp. TaxID=51671 RepID=UPI0039E4A4B7
MKSLFVSVVGQNDNIGDSVLRRGLITSVHRPPIQLHAYIGANSDDYVQNVGLGAQDVVYRDRAQWLSSMRLNRGRGVTSFLANAGEIAQVRGMRHLGAAQLRALASVRMRGGALLQSGVGVRHVERSGAGKMSALRFFDVVTWRDADSRAHAGVGEVSPDWAISTSARSSVEIDPEPRSRIAISLRGDRPAPSQSWIDAIRRFAEERRLTPIIVVQVRRDSQRAEELAARLSAELVPWQPGVPHAAQERIVRREFRRSLYVVSDRLHALVIGATEGAGPLGAPPAMSPKLRRTLDPIGVVDFLTGYDELSYVGISEPAAIAGRVLQIVEQAHRRLDDLSDVMVRQIVER